MDKQDHNSATNGRKIGLFGGSFNPAHEGHLEISLSALDRLNLDVIWWLVSPGNPLKDPSDMEPFEARMNSAQQIASDPLILVSDLEKKIGTKYTIDTLKIIKKTYPDDQFVWIMGADNLEQFDQWKDWETIANTVPFAIFNRPSYSSASLKSNAARVLGTFQIEEKDAGKLYSLTPPAWVYCTGNENPASSTEFRKIINNNKRLHT